MIQAFQYVSTLILLTVAVCLGACIVGLSAALAAVVVQFCIQTWREIRWLRKHV